MPLLSLNDDVIKIIISFISSPDAWRFAQTCHYVYDAAISKYLSSVTIRGWQLKRFCAFVLAEPSRKLSIRALEVFLGHDSECFPAFIEVLRGAGSLRWLSIEDLCGLLQSQPSLRSVLAAIPNLEHISYLHIYQESLEVLTHTVSRPRHLKVFFDINKGDAPFWRTLEKFTDCLETLEWGVYCGQKPDSSIVWPRVHSLSVKQGTRCMALSHLAHAFPNLRHLSIMARNDIKFDTPHLWASLDEVEARCFPFELFSCVRRLVLDVEIYKYTDLNRVLTMLQHMSPVVLECRTEYPGLISHLQSPALSLKYLQIYVARGDSKELHWPSIARDLRSLPLTALCLCNYFSWTTGVECDLVRLLGIAQQVAAMLPTLGHLGFDTLLRRRDEGRVPRWFCVVSRDGDIPQLELLSREQGEELELRLSSLDRS
ncbi:hypothetical protein BKA93DRAFT_105971 [Sparassis latifolia]